MSEYAASIRNAVIEKANSRLLEIARSIIASFRLEMQAARYERAINKSRGLPDTEVRDDAESNIMITKKRGDGGLIEYIISFNPDFYATCTPGEKNELEFRFGIAKHRALGRK